MFGENRSVSEKINIKRVSVYVCLFCLCYFYGELVVRLIRLLVDIVFLLLVFVTCSLQHGILLSYH